MEHPASSSAATAGNLAAMSRAAAAGIPCVAVSFGFNDRPPQELGATAVIDHFDELIPTLERIGAAAETA